MVKNVMRKVVADEPTDSDRFRGKGHERTALALADAINRYINEDRAIGLDGPWGSGKSSVIAIAAHHLGLEENRQQARHSFFTFDIWKSQGTGFRRSFLEHFVGWAKTEFPKKRTKLEEIQEDIRGKKRQISTNSQPVLGWFGIIVILLLPLLPIYYFWTKAVIDEIAKNENSKFSDILSSWPAITFYIFALCAIGATIKKMYSHNDKLDFKAALSSVLLISSKQHQDHMSIQKIREIDPSDYEFHTTLRRILSTVQSETQRVVVVLDNIDRLPQKEIRDYWAAVRSIFSGSHKTTSFCHNETITAIVPYDRLHIEGSVNEGSVAECSAKAKVTKQELTRLSSRELFSKTFDEVLTVSPPVLSNAREFFAEKLEEALPEQISKDHGFRTYRIFTELLRAEGGVTTPRQVVSFVNDVTGLFAIHDGEFPLPTVATYIAHQDLLSKDPSKLNDPEVLNPRIEDLASDPDIAKNLAAIVFNVQRDLAFEVLLDSPLGSAMVAANHQDLEKLSHSPGFDLRVDDVLQSNLTEWQVTDDFGKVIENFAQVLPNYGGASKSRIVSALVQGFAELKSFSFVGDKYRSFLLLFDLLEEGDRSELIKVYCERAFSAASQLDDADFDSGCAFAEFLGVSRSKFDELDLAKQFKKETSKLSPPSSADFLYGLAADIVENGLNFSDLGHIEISLPSEGSYFKDIAMEDPASALDALKQFSLKSLVGEQDWLEIANTCLQKVVEDSLSQEGIVRLLNLTCFSRSKLSKDKKKDISLSTTVTEGQFFRNLGDGGNEESAEAVALAFFLWGEEALGGKIPAPKKRQPNGQPSPDVSEEFKEFDLIVTGESDLSKSQARIVADKAKDAASIVGNWTKFGNDNKQHLAVRSVLKESYLYGTLPNISLFGLNVYFDYLTDILTSEAFIELLDRYGERLTKSDVSKITISDTSLGFLSLVDNVQNKKWNKYLDKVDELLRNISDAEWMEHLETFDHTTQILIEKVSTSGCLLESSKFRDPLVQAMLGVLSGKRIPSESECAFDELMKAVDGSFHADIWRRLRESINNVDANTLKAASHLFPLVLNNAISTGDRVSATEQDNIVRHILCPALDGNNELVLEVFIRLGVRRISEFKRNSSKSTLTMLQGTLESFSKNSSDLEWTKRVVGVVEGKKRAGSLISEIWGFRKDED